MRFDLPATYAERVLTFLANGMDLEGWARHKPIWWCKLSDWKKRNKMNQKRRLYEERRTLRFKCVLELLRRIPRNAQAWVDVDWEYSRALRIYWQIPTRTGGQKGRVNFVMAQDEWRSYPYAAPEQADSHGVPSPV